MPDFEKIAGQKVIDIFHQLHNDKTLVKISLPHIKYERLTVITNLRQNNNVRTFQIASPEGLNSIIQESEPGKINFEFTGSDHLPHKFTAAIKNAGPEVLLDWMLAMDYEAVVSGLKKIVRVAKPEREYPIDEVLGDTPYFTLDDFY